MADVPVLPHRRVVRAFERAGFRILREGRHVVMTNDRAVITLPRHNPVNRWTLAGIIKEAGMTVDEFRGYV